jgi:sugar/nucleoside kinase (ribokinase family)
VAAFLAHRLSGAGIQPALERAAAAGAAASAIVGGQPTGSNIHRGR